MFVCVCVCVCVTSIWMEIYRNVDEQAVTTALIYLSPSKSKVLADCYLLTHSAEMEQLYIIVCNQVCGQVKYSPSLSLCFWSPPTPVENI